MRRAIAFVLLCRQSRAYTFRLFGFRKASEDAVLLQCGYTWNYSSLCTCAAAFFYATSGWDRSSNASRGDAKFATDKPNGPGRSVVRTTTTDDVTDVVIAKQIG